MLVISISVYPWRCPEGRGIPCAASFEDRHLLSLSVCHHGGLHAGSRDKRVSHFDVLVLADDEDALEADFCALFLFRVGTRSFSLGATLNCFPAISTTANIPVSFWG